MQWYTKGMKIKGKESERVEMESHIGRVARCRWNNGSLQDAVHAVQLHAEAQLAFGIPPARWPPDRTDAVGGAIARHRAIARRNLLHLWRRRRRHHVSDRHHRKHRPYHLERQRRQRRRHRRQHLSAVLQEALVIGSGGGLGAAIHPTAGTVVSRGNAAVEPADHTVVAEQKVEDPVSGFWREHGVPLQGPPLFAKGPLKIWGDLEGEARAHGVVAPHPPSASRWQVGVAAFDVEHAVHRKRAVRPEPLIAVSIEPAHLPKVAMHIDGVPISEVRVLELPLGASAIEQHHRPPQRHPPRHLHRRGIRQCCRPQRQVIHCDAGAKRLCVTAGPGSVQRREREGSGGRSGVVVERGAFFQ
mmetsp:Transcript_27384/g.71834  ORF Transcript_27384/g.71834 Transcript_27384/m.71834 type:complete len:358 (-) Transcript_27384:94-1167(-)